MSAEYVKMKMAINNARKDGNVVRLSYLACYLLDGAMSTYSRDMTKSYDVVHRLNNYVIDSGNQQWAIGLCEGYRRFGEDVVVRCGAFEVYPEWGNLDEEPTEDTK